MSSFSKFFENLGQGKLGEIGVNTDIKFDNRSIINMGLTIFVAGVMIILSYHAITKLMK